MIGIIAEFNPLHNGHQRIIDIAKTIDENLVIAMSGNITQRGNFASIDKHTRASMAIKSGASIVVEIPPIFVASSAEYYAKGAVLTLQACGVEQIIFGSEIGDISQLENLYNLIQSKNVQNSIKQNIKLGNSYSASLLETFKNMGIAIDIITPNNILAIEYIKQCKKYGIKYQTIKRENNYNDSNINFFYPSATAIRELAQVNNFEAIKNFVPEHALFPKESFLTNNGLYTILREKILNTGEILLHDIYDATEGIENRIFNFAEKATSLEELIDLTTTRRYTKQKIQRFLLHILLKITKDNAKYMLNNIDYYNVLAINKNCINLLSNDLLCTKYKDFIAKNLLNSNHFKLQNSIDKLHSIINNKEFTFKNMVVVQTKN